MFAHRMPARACAPVKALDVVPFGAEAVVVVNARSRLGRMERKYHRHVVSLMFRVVGLLLAGKVATEASATAPANRWLPPITTG